MRAGGARWRNFDDLAIAGWTPRDRGSSSRAWSLRRGSESERFMADVDSERVSLPLGVSAVIVLGAMGILGATLMYFFA